MNNENNFKGASQMGEEYGMSAVAFNKLLEKCGVLQHTAKGYVLSEKMLAEPAKLTEVVERPFFLPSGIKAIQKRSVWTEKGQEKIRELLRHHGIVPVSEQRSLFG